MTVVEVLFRGHCNLEMECKAPRPIVLESDVLSYNTRDLHLSDYFV